MSKLLPKKFFQRPVLEVAPDLLGAVIAIGGSRSNSRHRITEVEAYDGEQDQACHASRGRTPRSEGLYREGGVFYIYLIYGMYYMLNIVTGPRDYPAAVLIRSVDTVSGPGRLTRELGINCSLHSQTATRRSGVWFERSGLVVPSSQIERTQRIGVEYAGEWAKKPYRFVLECDN